MMETTTFGKYHLRERINVGGMAEVFLADVDDQAGPVALKRVLPNVARNKEFISMFIDEARLSVQLNHGGIAQVLDAGKIDDSYFIALEHVNGKDLGALIKASRARKQPLSLAMACYIATKICDALHYAHNKKDPGGRPLELVHRDVSPSNILIAYTGAVKVTDFGLAKAHGKATQTQAGIVKGKHGYMSPEQAQGLSIDRRSDIFSVGVCLYEMVTGQRLFKGGTDFSTLQQVRAAEVPMLGGMQHRVPSELERIVLKMLARRPEDRYATADDAARDLQNFMADSGVMCGPRELSAYMGRLFASESSDAQRFAAKAPMSDGVTGLAAFDDLEPVSTVSALIELPDAPAPMLYTEQHAPVTDDLVPAAMSIATPTATPKVSGRSPTLVGMPIAPAPRVSSPPPAPRSASLPPATARANTLPPPPAPRVSTPPPAPRSASLPPATARANTLPPPPPRVSSLPPASARVSTLPPPPAPRKSSLPPAPPRLDHVAPSVQLDWPDEELATSRVDELDTPAPAFAARSSHAFDATEQLELPTQSVWDDMQVPSMSTDGLEVVDGGLSPKVKAGLAATLALLGLAGAYAWLSGAEPGMVRLEVMPADATVTLDGERVVSGNPYLLTELEPERAYALSVQKEGYRPWTTEIRLAAGQTLSLPSVVLEPERHETGFVLDSMPSGARVRIDGQDRGLVTPARVSDLAPGVHRIELEGGEGFAPWTTQVHVADGQVLELSAAELTPAAPAAVAATEHEPAAATDADDGVAEQPIAPRAERRRGAVRGKGRRAALARRSRAAKSTATRAPRAPAPRAAAATGGTGVLRINTQPWSNVFVDGRLVGNTPQMGIQLPAGRHRVTLVNQELGIRKLVEIDVPAGQTVTKIIQLSPGR